MNLGVSSRSRLRLRLPAGVRSRARNSGQSLVEVALLVPMFSLILVYAADIGYFYMVAASLSSSARSAGLYSIQGYTGVAASTLPTAGPISTNATVAALAVGDLSSFSNASVSASVYVCSGSLVTTSHPARCASYNSAPTPATVDTDPESTLFQLNRVDVYYTVKPPIELGGLLPTGFVPKTFHRSIELRSLN